MADDRVLLAGGQTADTAVARWRDLGVDIVRIHAVWWRIAPHARSLRPPARFRPADPADPRYAFGPLDEAIGRVRAAGMQVMLTITGPGPLWATSRPASRD